MPRVQKQGEEGHSVINNRLQAYNSDETLSLKLTLSIRGHLHIVEDKKKVVRAMWTFIRVPVPWHQSGRSQDVCEPGMSFDFVLAGTAIVVFDVPGTISSCICSAGVNTNGSAIILSDCITVVKCIVLWTPWASLRW